MDLFQLGHPRGGVGHGMDLVVVIQIFEAETNRWGLMLKGQPRGARWRGSRVFSGG